MKGAYGLNGLYVGVPTVIGAGGIEKVIDIKLDKDEQAMFDKSVEAARSGRRLQADRPVAAISPARQDRKAPQVHPAGLCVSDAQMNWKSETST